MKTYGFHIGLSLLLAATTALAQSDSKKSPVIAVERIWDRAKHSAFTDLVDFNKQLFCTFREGAGHVHGANGTIRIIRSDDGQIWRSVALLDKKGIDLRDPKICVTPDGRLMILMGGSHYDNRTLIDRQTRVSFSNADGTRFEKPRPIELPRSIRSSNDWLWRVTWYGDTGYGVLYQPIGEESKLQLVSTADGIHYQHIATLDIDGRPNETTLRFRSDGAMIAMIRREAGNKSGIIGISLPPYQKWQWHELGARLGGPNFIIIADKHLLGGSRKYGAKAQTILAWMDLEGSFTPAATLPSDGDTSYPGMVIRDDLLLVSYYSSHEEKTAIYLATLKLSALRKD